MIGYLLIEISNYHIFIINDSSVKDSCLFTILIFEFGIVPIVWYFFFHLIYMYIHPTAFMVYLNFKALTLFIYLIFFYIFYSYSHEENIFWYLILELFRQRGIFLFHLIYQHLSASIVLYISFSNILCSSSHEENILTFNNTILYPLCFLRDIEFKFITNVSLIFHGLTKQFGQPFLHALI